MDKKSFFKKVYSKLEGKYSRKELEEILNAFRDTLRETLEKNETISTSLGVFKTTKRKSRVIRSIDSGKLKEIPEQKRIIFRFKGRKDK
jgi:nucleoid DNA-binding protein